MFVCCECCVLSGRGPCDELITRPEESYRLWCVVVCDLETSSRMGRPWPALGCSAIEKKYIYLYCLKSICRIFCPANADPLSEHMSDLWLADTQGCVFLRELRLSPVSITPLVLTK